MAIDVLLGTVIPSSEQTAIQRDDVLASQVLTESYTEAGRAPELPTQQMLDILLGDSTTLETPAQKHELELEWLRAHDVDSVRQHLMSIEGCS